MKTFPPSTRNREWEEWLEALRAIKPETIAIDVDFPCGLWPQTDNECLHKTPEET